MLGPHLRGETSLLLFAPDFLAELPNRAFMSSFTRKLVLAKVHESNAVPEPRKNVGKTLSW